MFFEEKTCQILLSGQPHMPHKLHPNFCGMTGIFLTLQGPLDNQSLMINILSSLVKKIQILTIFGF